MPLKRSAWFSLGLVLLLCASQGATSRPTFRAPPQLLSETGLYVNGSTEVRPELVAFSPQYPLWSDGATKRRWISLPAGTAIDASDPDAWVFPSGTRLWKEFSFAGRRIETRLIERLLDGSWRYAAYAWSADGREATLVPVGIAPALPCSEPSRERPLRDQTERVAASLRGFLLRLLARR